jgi:hypothetical protein
VPRLHRVVLTNTQSAASQRTNETLLFNPKTALGIFGGSLRGCGSSYHQWRRAMRAWPRYARDSRPEVSESVRGAWLLIDLHEAAQRACARRGGGGGGGGSGGRRRRRCGGGGGGGRRARARGSRIGAPRAGGSERPAYAARPPTRPPRTPHAQSNPHAEDAAAAPRAQPCPMPDVLKITGLDCHILLVPDVNPEAMSSSQDEFLVVVSATAEDGRPLSGVGESDANPWIMKECIETFGTHIVGLGIKQMLLGENALEIERLWKKMYAGTYMNGRRGIVLHAMGAVEMALHDLRGKYYHKPAWQLLGRPARPEQCITPYASLQPEGVSTVSEYKEELCSWVGRAKQLGFRAGKCEVTLSGPYAHLGMTAGDERITEIVAAARDEAGSPESFQIMVDVQYTWDGASSQY